MYEFGFDIKLVENSQSGFAIRANITSESEAGVWLNNFEEAEKVCFNLTYRYPKSKSKSNGKGRVICHHKYICHHGNPKWNGKKITFTGCKVTLDIKIHNFKDASRTTLWRKTDEELHYPCLIKYRGEHNHTIESAESLHELRVAPVIKDKFDGYFDMGMTAAQASRFHEEEMNLDITHRADNSLNPSKRAVYYLREKWVKRNSAIGMVHTNDSLDSGDDFMTLESSSFVETIYDCSERSEGPNHPSDSKDYPLEESTSEAVKQDFQKHLQLFERNVYQLADKHSWKELSQFFKRMACIKTANKLNSSFKTFNSHLSEGISITGAAPIGKKRKRKGHLSESKDKR